MATLETADGRLLRSSGPSGYGGFGPNRSQLLAGSGSVWSDGSNDLFGDGREGRRLKSFDAIYRSQPVVAGTIDKLARRAASLPHGVFTIRPDGSRNPVDPSNGLATLLRRPRKRVSSVHFFTHIYTSLMVHGNALAAELRTHGDPDLPPDMMWPLDWSKTSAYGEPGGDIEWWSTTQFGGEERFIAAEDVIHFAWPGPDGGMIGVSPLEKLGVTIQAEDAAQKSHIGTLDTGYRPTLAITLGQPNPKRELLDMTRASIEALRRKGDKTILLGSDTKVQTLSMSPVDVQLIDQRRINREEIAIVFDLAGPSLSDTTNASAGNVKERMAAFYRDILPPWATLVTETLEAQLVEPVPEWIGNVIRVDFSDKLRGEPREQAETLKTLVEAGLLTRDEARYELGKPPEGGPADSLTVNANNQNTLAALDGSESAPAE